MRRASGSDESVSSGLRFGSKKVRKAQWSAADTGHVVIHRRLARPIFVRGICRARNSRREGQESEIRMDLAAR